MRVGLHPLVARGVLLAAGCGGLLTAGWALAPTGLRAQDPPLSGGTTPLGVRQQRVELMMEDLDRKFQALQRAIGEKEPERAERLKITLDKAKELLIQKRMGDITKLLDQTQLETASDGQKAVLAG